MSRTRIMITTACAVTVAGGTAIALAATGSASAGPAKAPAAKAVTAAAAKPALAEPAAASAPPTTGSFTVRAHHGSETSIDLGRHGFSAGDEDLLVSPLTYLGKRVGRLVGNCTTTRVGNSSADQLCEFVLVLNGSQLTASGTVRAGTNGPGTFRLSILGGTGRYRGASGTLAVTSGNGSTIPMEISLDR